VIAACIVGVAKVVVAPVGFEVTTPLMEIVFVAAATLPWAIVAVRVVLVFNPTEATEAATATDVTTPVEASVALAGATEDRTPKPREATATSARRLKVVFVDICFLSISQDQEFPALGLGNIWPLICHERAFERSSSAGIHLVHRLLRCN
jgi:hypothetical protein